MLKNGKKELVKELVATMDGKSIVFINYEGIDMPAIDEIRGSIRSDGSTLRVVKNTLLRRVLKEGGNVALADALPEDVFTGMTAVTLIDEENFASSGKAVLEAEKQKSIKIKAALHEGRVLNADEVRLLASIPSKEELYSILVGALTSIIGKLVVVLDEVKGQKEA